MDLFKRIGTQKKKFKVQFFIGRLKFSAFVKGKIYIVIKRGNHKLKSQNQLEMPKDLKLNFNKEILEMQNTLYFDEKSHQHLQKIGQIKIILLDQQKQKILLGSVRFDIAEYANSENIGQKNFKEKKKLQQTPKKLQGLIQYDVFVDYIGEGSESSFDKIQTFFFGKGKDNQTKGSPSSSSLQNKNKKQEQIKQIRSDSNIKSSEIITPQIQSENKMRRSISPKKEDDFYQTKQSKTDNKKKRKNFYYNVEQEQEGTLNKEHNSRDIKNGFSKKQLKTDDDQNMKNKKNRQSVGDKKHAINNSCFDQPQVIKRQQQMVLQIQLWKRKHGEMQDENKKFRKQVEKLKKQNGVLEQKNSNMNKQLKQKTNQLNRLKSQAQRETILQKGKFNQNQDIQNYEKQIKRLQKEKNERLVQISRMKQKHKNDLIKLQQLLNEKSQHKDNGHIELKLQNQKLKQECNQNRQKVLILTKEKDQKIIEMNKHKNEKRTLQDELTEVKTSLSKIKLKICSLINQSLTKGEDNIAEMLTTLTNQ